ncbi:MAG TPA: immunoglobulin domain-containing protein [Planctomycetota bacterium]|nr:immunoglobulin domain-containing protein [Planctomycetota bacterium]
MRHLLVVVLALIAVSLTAADPYNAAPTVSALGSSAATVTTTTVDLVVTAADDGGEAALTYTWVILGAPPAQVSASGNGTNAAKRLTATFYAPGAYQFGVIVRDALGAATSVGTVNVSVVATLTTLAVLPATTRVAPSTTQAFRAEARSQFGVPLATQPAIAWSVSGGGAIATSGVFTAGATAGGPWTVTATTGGKTGTASVTIGTNAAPTIATAATATPTAVTGTDFTLAVLGADDAGEAGLSYAWFFTAAPTGAVISGFAPMNTNQAKSMLTRVDRPGTYGFFARITDGGGRTVDSATVTVTVAKTNRIVVTPATALVNPGATQAFTASTLDQFGVATAATFAWTASGGGAIASTGVFTAGSTAGGPFTVTATGSGLSGTAQVRVNAAPTVARTAAAQLATVAGTTVNLSVLGADDGGEDALIYTWSTSGTPPAAVAFAPNGTSAAKNATATFAKVGGYTLLCTITDVQGRTVTSSIPVSVAATLSAVAVTPASASVVAGGTRAFAASARDQFAAALATQPAFTWTASGGGTISTAGLFTAGATAGGPFTVTAATGGKSGTAAITVTTAATAPAITAQPVNKSVLVGQTATFTVTASGNPTPTYQWQKNAVNIAGATTASYTTPATVIADNAAAFRCIATNSAGSATSTAATLTVTAATAPAITAQPVNKSVLVGQTATFTVTASGNPTPTYQWQKNAVNIAGATTASYTTPATVIADNAAAFRCIATNSAGSATSTAATLTVTAATAPAITAQPVNKSVLVGQTATFTVTASGNPTPTYQWQKNAVNIAGATAASYTTPATVIADNAAAFRCIATNSAGSATSTAATLTVTAATAPAITAQPVNTSVLVGQTATFTVTATGNPTPTYQWQKNAVNIAGATAASYTTPATVIADNAAAFRCIATNSAGSATSTAATLTVTSATTPGVAFSAASSTVAESGSPINVTATLSPAPAAEAVIALAISGTADDVDRALSTRSLVFAPGQSTATVVVTPIDDDRIEGNETVVLTIPANPAATVGTPATHTLTIADNDAPALPAVSFATAAMSGQERDAAPALLVVLDRASTTTVTVAYQATGGTAVAGTHYTLAAGPLSFSPGQTSRRLPLTITDNTAVDTDRTIDLALSAPVGAVIGAIPTATFTIADDDAASATRPSPPSFDPPTGSYFAPLAVEIAADPAYAQLWTTQGAAPADPAPNGTGSTRYAGPLTITATTTVKAVAALAAGATTTTGDVASATYTILPNTGYVLTPRGVTAGASARSPVCIEIADPTAGMAFGAASWSGGRQFASAPVHIIGDRLAYADAPLAPSGATEVRFTVRDPRGGTLLRSSTVTWSPTDLTTMLGTITIRRGDSLLFTATGAGANLVIDGGNGGAPAVVRPGGRAPWAYPVAGDFTATATIDGRALGSAVIKVVDTPFPAAETVAAEVNFPRPYAVLVRPDNSTSAVQFIAADPAVLTVAVTGGQYDRALMTLKPLKRGTPVLLARLGTNGPIIAAKEVSEFTQEAVAIGYAGEPYATGIVVRPAPTWSTTGFFTRSFDDLTGEAVGMLGHSWTDTVTSFERVDLRQVPGLGGAAIRVSRSDALTDAIHRAQLSGQPYPTSMTVGAGADIDGDGLADYAFPIIPMRVDVVSTDPNFARRLRLGRPVDVADYASGAIVGHLRSDYASLRSQLMVNGMRLPMPMRTVGLGSGSTPFLISSRPTQPMDHLAMLLYRLYYPGLEIESPRIVPSATPTPGGGTTSLVASYTVSTPSGSVTVNRDKDGKITPEIRPVLRATVDATGWCRNIVVTGDASLFDPNDVHPSITSGPGRVPAGTYSIGFGGVRVEVAGCTPLFSEIYGSPDWMIDRYGAESFTGLGPDGVREHAMFFEQGQIGMHLYRMQGDTTPITVSRSHARVNVRGPDGTQLFAAGALTASFTDSGTLMTMLTPEFVRDDSVTLSIGANGSTSARMTLVRIGAASGPARARETAVDLVPPFVHAVAPRGNLRLEIPVKLHRTPIAGPDLLLTYDSGSGFDEGLGVGWRTNLDARVVFFRTRNTDYGSRNLAVIDETGRGAVMADSGEATGSPATERYAESAPTADPIGVVLRRNSPTLPASGAWKADERFQLVRPDGRSSFFNDKGGLVRIRHLDGQELIVARDANDRAVSVRDARGRIVQVATLLSGAPLMAIAATAGEAGAWSFQYDANKQLSRIALAGSGRTAHGDFRLDTGVNQIVLLPKFVDPKLRLTALGRDGATVSDTFVYDDAASPAKTTWKAALGGDTVWLGSTETVDRVGVRRFQVLSGDRVIERWTGTPTTKFSRRVDTWDGPVIVRSESWLDGEATQIEEFTWSALLHVDRPIPDTRALVATRSLAVAGLLGGVSDCSTRLWYGRATGDLGRALGHTDACGATTLTRYDGDGMPRRIVDARNESWMIESRTPFGQPRLARSPEKRPTTTTYDEPAGVETTVTDRLGYQTGFVRDQRQRVVRTNLPGGAFTETDYDPLGRVTRTRDEMGRQSELTYDVFGRLRRVHAIPIASEAGTTDTLTDETIAYVREDVATKPTWVVTRSRGTLVLSKQRFDAAGRLIEDIARRTLVAGSTAVTDQITRYAYDPVSGFPTTVTDARGNATILEHDDAGRLITTTSPEGVVVEQEWNGLGWLLAVRNAVGVTSFTYDACGRRVRTVDPLGAWSETGYDAAGAPIAAGASQGRGESVLRDRDGEASGAVDRFGGTTSRTVTGSGAAATVTTTTPSGAIARAALNSAGLPTAATTVVDGQSFTTALTARADGSTASTTPSGLGAVGVALDGFGRARKRTVPMEIDGATQTKAALQEYDALGLPTESIDPFGQRRKPEIHTETGEVQAALTNDLAPDATPTALKAVARVLERDADGRLLRFGAYSGAEAAGAPPALVTVQTWDRDGRLKTRRGPDGILVSYDYDDAGRPFAVTRGTRRTTTTFDAAGNATSMTDPAGRTSSTTYDRLGRVLTRTAGGETTTSVYDDATLALREVRDAGGRTTTYGYDDVGRLTAVTDPDGRTTRHGFDALGRETRTTFGDGSVETRAFAADRGAVATHTDRAGRVATAQFDPSGRVRARTIVDGAATTAMTYALATPPGGASAGIIQRSTLGGQTIERRLDRAGRLVSLTLPGQAAVAFSYDLAGRQTARAGTTMTYDPVTGRLSTVASAGIGSLQLAYDSDGRVMLETLGNGVRRTWGYDAAGLVATLTQNAGPITEAWSYARDGAGRITRIDAPDHADIYRYETGRLAREERTGTAPRIALYALDGAGNRTAAAFYDAPVAGVEAFAAATVPARVQSTAGTWAIASGQLRATGTGSAQAGLALVSGANHLGPDLSVKVLPTVPSAGTTLAAFRVAGAAGTRYRVGWQVRPHATPDFSTPPGQGRLIIQRVDAGGAVDLAASAWIGEPATTARTITLTQWPDERIGVTGAGLSCEAACPGVGRLSANAGQGLEVAAGVGTGAVAALFDDLTWATTTVRNGHGSTYDGFNRKTAHDEAGTAGTAAESYAYDAAGHLIGRTRTGVGATTMSYAYDVIGRMTRATVGGVATDYAYLGDSWMRATATTGGAVTSFRWDGQSMLARTAGGTTTSYLTHRGRTLAEARGGVAFTYGFDGLGNATGVVGTVATGPVPGGNEYLQRFDYDAYGAVTERMRVWNGTVVTYTPTTAMSGPRYRGMWFDGAGTGLYKTQTRSYSPDMGRFTQVDPIRAGQNWYAYAADPVNYWDPTGLVAVLIHGVNTDAAWFERAEQGLNDYWDANGMQRQRIIHFKWGDKDGDRWLGGDKQGGLPNYATDNVADMYANPNGGKDRRYLGNAATRLRQLLDQLNAIKVATGSDEEITVIAHSQGSLITLGALQAGGSLDQLIIQGSPLDELPFDPFKSDILKARRRRAGIRGNLYNYWSKHDEWAHLKGGVGAHGDEVAKTPGMRWIINREFGPGKSIHAYTLPSDKARGFDEYDHSDYMELPEFFRHIHAHDAGKVGDGKITNFLNSTSYGPAAGSAVGPHYLDLLANESLGWKGWALPRAYAGASVPSSPTMPSLPGTP